MRGSVSRTLAVVGVAAAIALGVSTPAFAGSTDTTFTITGGTLSISNPASANLGSASSGASTLSAQLGTVTVTDNRGANLGTYTAQVQGTAFTTGSGASAYSIPATAVAYSPPAVIGGTGTAVRVPGLPGAIDSPRTAVTVTGVLGNNTSVWNPTVTVTLPSDVVAGSYSGTITHSVA